MIRNEQVLQKMLQEVKEALEISNQSLEVKAHAKSIRLLCDLLIDTEEELSNPNAASSSKHPTSNELELQKMMGDMQSQTINQPKKLEEKEANGDSIFDF
ncbi:hypothetical protein BN1058_00368 [Paraliobacillus sp. PM-2]|uniref:YwdI family protein n=1 Tax=Paraliobacillus sp. PM-2 TaxID=1462524 RepID=UPI00061BA1ED|nr:YwdI family protein [Paraliobacillus sp. PM-2]CQR46119.1 hypothetical protein BN1058_00368 [Paraliobacillus sp. PM-2]